ncbi:ABC-2 transporter permease [Paenibacillus senegalensis]|uniref:ABC-2 transporter permease n=1 Tax=Paenibacillus senegalensis TaxID=1465766 RepID=UPI000288B9E1|nr:ABC-2 transporter permease [Paenibacillus senegalensis]
MVKGRMTWANCKRLLMRDFQQDGLHIFTGLLLVLLFAIIGSPFLMESQNTFFYWGARDIYFMAVVSTLGFSLMSKEYRSFGWKKAPITKKLMFLKSMPISAKEIIGSRVLYFLITFIFYGTVFFSVLGYVWLREGNALSEFVIFALVWLSYGLAVGSFYLWMEITQGEKIYFISSFIIIGIFILLTVLLRLAGFSLYDLIIDGTKTYGFILPLCTIPIAVFISLICVRAAVGGLDRRELA